MDLMRQEPSGSTTDQQVYALTPHLEFDPYACVLLRRSRRIPLTARECELLSKLLRTPRRYVSAALLGRHLSKPDSWPVDEHSVQQSICNLRRKLGEDANRPKLLLTKRGVGYGIFPQAPIMNT